MQSSEQTAGKIKPDAAVARSGRKHPRLSIDHLSKSFGGISALTDFSISLDEGEIRAIAGENGAGKSTLIKAITGVQPADTGSMELDGAKVWFSNAQEARNSGIAAVYQDPQLFPHLTVAENIFVGQYPIHGGRIDRGAMEKHAAQLLDKFGFNINPTYKVSQLSVAESEYVEIARAMSSDLKVLILDEPTSSLTLNEARSLYDAVKQLRDDTGASIIWISHRMEEIRDLVDSVTVMRDGRLVQTSRIEDITDDELIASMVGHPVHARDRLPVDHTADKVTLAVKGISSEDLFENISFDIHRGEILGLAGLVGSGRTEVAQAIFGINKINAGSVTLNGKDITNHSTRDIVDKGLIYLPENRDLEGVLPAMGVQDNITLPNLPKLSRAGLRRRKREREAGLKEKEYLQIKATMEQPVSSLSGGNRQKVALARWLERDPDVLILDEPTHGIDILTKTEVHDIIYRIAQEGRSVLVISSDMPELLEITDRIIVLSRGRQVAEFAAQDATQESILQAAVKSNEG